MKVLGLTGDIACGKSSVAQILAEKGAAPLDSDLLVRELYADREFASQVQTLLPSNICDSQGHVDRARLGALVFGDAALLRRLESLVHPAVSTLRAQKMKALEAEGQKVVTLEAVKLLESGQGKQCDEIWCVICAPEVQLRRLMQNRGLKEEEARIRLQNQPTRANKLALAQGVPLVWIENNGSLDELRADVTRKWTQFLA